MDKVVHFEIPADEVERAKKFYEEAFGWQINIIPSLNYGIAITGPSDPDTGMPKEPAFINGGMFKRAEVKNPVITINVDSIDEAIKRVESLGGKIIHAKESVGEMGFSAYFADTEGNVMGLWEAKG